MQEVDVFAILLEVEESQQRIVMVASSSVYGDAWWLFHRYQLVVFLSYLDIQIHNWWFNSRSPMDQQVIVSHYVVGMRLLVVYRQPLALDCLKIVLF